MNQWAVLPLRDKVLNSLGSWNKDHSVSHKSEEERSSIDIAGGKLGSFDPHCPSSDFPDSVGD